MRRFTVVLMALTMLALVVPSAQAAPYCGVRWGSLAKGARGMSPAPITDVRAGQHRCFDRLVFEVDGRAPDYRIAYVDTVRAQGTGAAIPLRGGAALGITVRAPAHDARGRPTIDLDTPRHLVGVRGFRTFRQVAWGGSFEGQTTVGLGVRARLPFRAFVLAGPGSHHRLVIDVAHRW